MRAWVLPVLLALSAPASAQDWRVLRIYDGDTFYVEIPALPAELREVGIRIRGIDTPEIGGKARCGREKSRGIRAKARLTELLKGTIEYRDLSWDKYGGRIDATVFAAGVDVAAVLIREGFARQYDGGSRRGWCW